MVQNKKLINAVFEGGGVKGIGLAGAITATERLGYSFNNVAGTSAGAIVASLIAAGYSAAELFGILQQVDYKKFKDTTGLGWVPLIGPAVNLIFKKGIYEGDVFERWLRDFLAKKNVHTFGDLVCPDQAHNPLCKYRLQVIASDITNGKLLVLPGDSEEYGIHPEQLDVARAVRMSMSIPYFYQPVAWRNNKGVKSYIVDGGLLSNFPVFLFDEEGKEQTVPTIGYKLVEPEEGKPHKIYGPITFFAALFTTMMEAHDNRYIEDKNFMRTVPIPTLGVQSTDFSLDEQIKHALYESGVNSAEHFFSRWDFARYKQDVKDLLNTHRTDRLKKGYK